MVIDAQERANMRRKKDEAQYHAALSRQMSAEFDAWIARVLIDAKVPLESGRLCWICGAVRDGGDKCPCGEVKT